MQAFLELYGESTKTALGFFWKSGWAFLLIAISSVLIKLTYPKKWIDETHEMMKEEEGKIE